MCYNNDDGIITISQHIENPGIEQVIQAYSETFSNIHAWSGILSDIQALLRRMEL